jgi:sec-independent protein translocase protein TatB
LLRYVRSMAGNAQQQLSKELGPEFEDVDIRDLNPKAFIQKHLLDDVEPVVADVKKELTAAKTLGADVAEDVDAAIKAQAATNGNSNGQTNGHLNGQLNGETNGTVHPRVLTPFDPDAT